MALSPRGLLRLVRIHVKLGGIRAHLRPRVCSIELEQPEPRRGIVEQIDERLQRALGGQVGLQEALELAPEHVGSFDGVAELVQRVAEMANRLAEMANRSATAEASNEPSER